MSFNSLQYALFLPTVVVLHWTLPRRWRIPLLLAASYTFYASWDYRFLSLLLLSTVVDFAVGRVIGRSTAERTRRAALAVSVTVNLAILGFFKYFDFFVGSAAELLDRAGVGANEPVLEVILPVGISFYTFQTISYTVDVYRRRMQPASSLLVFALYVAFFPQLVAGPIERARRLLPQLQPDRPAPDSEAVRSALGLIVLGLVKKVVIADTMAPIVEESFGRASTAGSAVALVGVLAFAVQIYGDFSGYTDIARGSARLVSVELMQNFRQPYLARNITEFWRRWHISLSEWLRDYLYVPLGGNRRSPRATYRNLMVVMLLGGLWHGAGWTFVVWGALHGGYLAAHRALMPAIPPDEPLRASPRQVARIAGTFGLVCLAWVFFRAESVGHAFDVLAALARPDPAVEAGHVILVAAGALAMLAIDLVQRNGTRVLVASDGRPVLTGAALGVALTGLVLVTGAAPVPFIYFQF